MTFLLDTNLLIALGWTTHEHHSKATRWLGGVTSFATCPLTQAGFIRISLNLALGYASGPADVFRSLDSMLTDPRHVFWPDDLSFAGSQLTRRRIQRHSEVTDHYLVALARHHSGVVATFDAPLARAFANEASLVTFLG